MIQLHPNQLELQVLTPKHLEVLASYAAAEVFAEMGPYKPRAIREVAANIGKTSASVGEHVKKLVEVGLLIQVGTQKRRSRIEALYVHGAIDYRLEPAGYPEPERSLYIERFLGQMRLLGRQHTAFQNAAYSDDIFSKFYAFDTQYVFLSPEKMELVRDKFQEFIQFALDHNELDPDLRDSDECVRVNVCATIVPTQVESRRRTTS